MPLKPYTDAEAMQLDLLYQACVIFASIWGSSPSVETLTLAAQLVHDAAAAYLNT